MSYDLYFVAEPAPQREEFFAYFEARQNFTLQGAQAWYDNQETGIYFSFDWHETGTRAYGSSHEDEGVAGNDEEDVDEDGTDYWASFNINYFRPSAFGEEAAIELEAFVRRFGLAIEDPQREGMGRANFYPDGFLRGYAAGNRFAYRVAREEHDMDPPVTLPQERLLSVWRWNYQRWHLQEQLPHVFVPKVNVLQTPAGVVTSCTWGDGIPVALPEVDTVTVVRQSLVRRRWLRETPKLEVALAPWSAFSDLLGPATLSDGQHRYHLLEHEAPSAQLVKRLRSFPTGGDIQMLSADSVLDAELSS